MTSRTAEARIDALQTFSSRDLADLGSYDRPQPRHLRVVPSGTPVTETPNLPAVIEKYETPYRLGIAQVTRSEVRAAQDRVTRKAIEDRIAYRRAQWRKNRDYQAKTAVSEHVSPPSRNEIPLHGRRPKQEFPSVINVVSVPIDAYNPVAQEVVIKHGGQDSATRKPRYFSARRPSPGRRG